MCNRHYINCMLNSLQNLKHLKLIPSQGSRAPEWHQSDQMHSYGQRADLTALFTIPEGWAIDALQTDQLFELCHIHASFMQVPYCLFIKVTFGFTLWWVFLFLGHCEYTIRGRILVLLRPVEGHDHLLCVCWNVPFHLNCDLFTLSKDKGPGWVY